MRKPLLPPDNPGIINFINRTQAIDQVIRLLEDKIDGLFSARHEYPVWPSHNRQLDAMEREIHEPIREIYYDYTKFCIELLHLIKGNRV